MFRNAFHTTLAGLGLLAGLSSTAIAQGAGSPPDIGSEVSIQEHLADGEEFTTSLRHVLLHGRDLFAANWTGQEGGGRPFVKGTGTALADSSSPLVFPHNFNRVSAPDANSCAGCHNAPFGIPGGGGDYVTNVFVLAQRFDFATFDELDSIPTRGGMDESGRPVELQTIANSRSTLGMFGSGYIEVLARQMTADLQAIRDGIQPGGSAELLTKGVSFGTLARNADGTWDVSRVEGLPGPSTATTGDTPPNLLLRPFHQAGAVISLRQFSNNAFPHHHGVQPIERVGAGADPDGDGFVDEMTVADVTAVSAYQATLQVPGRVIPRHPRIEAAVRRGEDLFVEAGCVSCHVPYLEIDGDAATYTEPNPYNPPGNLRPEDDYVLANGTFSLDLNRPGLPGHRLIARNGKTRVPAFTDLKQHDITSGPDDPNREPLDMLSPAGSMGFFSGNGKFLTKKLWGMANEAPFFHHGLYTTIRQAVEAHAGEAQASRDAYGALSAEDQDAVIEFLKTLQVLPKSFKGGVVDERGRRRTWREFPWSPPAN